MSKKYLGKELPEMFEGPQTRQVPNPNKMEPVKLMAAWIKWLKSELSDWTDLDQLYDFQDYIRGLVREAERQDAEPDEVTETIWTGSVQHERIKCGKPGCKCTEGELHGPYWYHYPNAS